MRGREHKCSQRVTRESDDAIDYVLVLEDFHVLSPMMSCLSTAIPYSLYLSEKNERFVLGKDEEILKAKTGGLCSLKLEPISEARLPKGVISDTAVRKERIAVESEGEEAHVGRAGADGQHLIETLCIPKAHDAVSAG